MFKFFDFNFSKAFNSYDILDGVKCQTTPKTMSQLEAAVEAVKAVGLNQIHEVKKEWFGSEKQYNMFCRRLNVLNQNLI